MEDENKYDKAPDYREQGVCDVCDRKCEITVMHNYYPGRGWVAVIDLCDVCKG